MMDDLISRKAAIDTEGLDEQIRCEMCRNPMHTDRGCDGNCKYDERLYERIMQILGERIKPLPSAQLDVPDTNVGDTIYRQAAIDALGEKPLAWTEGEYELGMQNQWQSDIDALKELPSAQPTLLGYNIEHLELIARILQKEDLPPERVAEALTDVGRIEAIVRAEFEEELKRAVERCMI